MSVKNFFCVCMYTLLFDKIKSRVWKMRKLRFLLDIIMRSKIKKRRIKVNDGIAAGSFMVGYNKCVSFTTMCVGFTFQACNWKCIGLKRVLLTLPSSLSFSLFLLLSPSLLFALSFVTQTLRNRVPKGYIDHTSGNRPFTLALLFFILLQN